MCGLYFYGTPSFKAIFLPFNIPYFLWAFCAYEQSSLVVTWFRWIFFLIPTKYSICNKLLLKLKDVFFNRFQESAAYYLDSERDILIPSRIYNVIICLYFVSTLYTEFYNGKMLVPILIVSLCKFYYFSLKFFMKNSIVVRTLKYKPRK